jgi:hypothetical protein
MYVGKQYTSTQTVAVDRDFRCSCGYTSVVKVFGVGQGGGNSAYFLDNQGAAERAEASALRAATKNADLTLKLCPCPRCGKRQGAGAFIVLSVLSLIGISAFMWVIGAVLDLTHGGRSSTGATIFGLLAVIMPIIVFFTSIRWKWTTAAGRVVFPKESDR